jgi:hypothetical protein
MHEAGLSSSSFLLYPSSAGTVVWSVYLVSGGIVHFFPRLDRWSWAFSGRIANSETVNSEI